MASNYSQIKSAQEARKLLVLSIDIYTQMTLHNRRRQEVYREPAYTPSEMAEQERKIKALSQRINELEPPQHSSLQSPPFFVSPPPPEVQVPSSYITSPQSGYGQPSGYATPPSPYGQAPGYAPPPSPYGQAPGGYGPSPSFYGQPSAYAPLQSLAPAAPLPPHDKKKALIRMIIGELNDYKTKRMKQGPSLFGIPMEVKCDAVDRIIAQLQAYCDGGECLFNPSDDEMTCQLFVPTDDKNEITIALHGKEMEAVKEGRLYTDIMGKYFDINGNTFKLKETIPDLSEKERFEC